MSIKIGTTNANTVVYDDEDVKQIKLDGSYVWCKPYTYTAGSITGLASLTCKRQSTNEPTASTGTVATGGTIYHGDKLYWTATASTGYRVASITYGSTSSLYTVGGNITGTTTSGVSIARISGSLSQGTLPTGVASITCYRKAYDGSSFSTFTSGTIYYGDQFYWTATATTGYNNPSLTYYDASHVYTWTGSQGGSITSVSASGLSAGSRKSIAVNFTAPSYGYWDAASKTAYYGDIISTSNQTVTCYKWDATSTIRWTNTVHKNDDSSKVDYQYSTPTVSNGSFPAPDGITSTQTITATNSRSYKVYTVTGQKASSSMANWDKVVIDHVSWGNSRNDAMNNYNQGIVTSKQYSYNSTTYYYTEITTTDDYYYEWAGGGTYDSKEVYGEVILTDSNFSLNVANLTAVKYESGDITAVNKMGDNTVYISAGTGISSAYWVFDNSDTAHQSGETFKGHKSVYGRVVLADYYKAASGWTLISGTADTAGAVYKVGYGKYGTYTGTTLDFGTINALPKSYSITVTKNTGINKIYYKVNGASSFTEWTSGTLSANYNSTVYWYATASTGYSSSGLGSSSSPKSFTMGTSGTIAPTTSVLSFTLSISVTNGSYGSYGVSRTSSPLKGASTGALSNGATIYYGDVLTSTHSANADSATSWGNWSTITVPSATTTGNATSGNLTVKNEHSAQVTLYYNTTNSTSGGTSLGTAAASATKYKDGLSFDTNYYIYAYGAISRTGTHYTYGDTSTYNGTASVTGNVNASFSFTRYTITDNDSSNAYSSITTKKTAARNQYTLTVTRNYYAITGAQSKASSTTADTQVTQTKYWGETYSYTYSKTGYTSQTYSATCTGNASTTLTLSPTQYTISQNDISNASESINYAWVYYGYSVTQTVTPNQGYDYTVSSTRYYNGNAYTRSSGAVSANYTFGSLTMNQFDYTVSGGTASNGSVAWSGNKKIGQNATWTITANNYYARPSTYTGTKTINSTNFTLSEANKTAVYSGSLGTCSPYTYTIQEYARTGGTVTWSTSSSGTYTSTLAATYGSTVYWKITPNTEYNAPSTASGSMTLNNTNFTISSTTSNGDATYKGSAIANCTRKTYTITFTNGTYGTWNTGSITAQYGDTISRSGNVVTIYKWDATTTARSSSTYSLPANTAQYTYSTSYPTLTTPITASKSYQPTDSRATNTYTITLSATYGTWKNSGGTTITQITGVAYGTAVSKSGTTLTVGSNTYTFNKNADDVQYTYTNAAIGDVPSSVTGATTISGSATRNTRVYTVSGISSNGTVYWSTSAINSSGGSTSLSNVSYGTTVYYRIDAATGYNRPAIYYGSYAVNSTNFTLNTSNLTATKALSACSIQTCTVTWKYLSAYPDTWTTTTETYNYEQTPSRSAPATVTNSSNNERKTNGTWGTISPIAANEGTRTIQASYTAQVKCTISGTNCSANKTSGEWYNAGTVITWTAFTGYHFGSDRSKTTDTATVALGTTSYSKTASISVYRITINRNYYAITGAQSKASSTTADTAVSIEVTYNQSYSYTYSKTGYDSQTTSGTWVVDGDGATTLTLNPHQYTVSQTAISNASESVNYAWVYYNQSATQTVTPDTGYDYTASSVRYYNGKSYTRSSGAITADYTFGALTMNKFDYTVSGGSSSNGSVAWTGNKKINSSATWTITANAGYIRPTNYTGSATINATNFTLSEANKTAVYKSNFDPCTTQNWTATITIGEGVDAVNVALEDFNGNVIEWLEQGTSTNQGDVLTYTKPSNRKIRAQIENVSSNKYDSTKELLLDYQNTSGTLDALVPYTYTGWSSRAAVQDGSWWEHSIKNVALYDITSARTISANSTIYKSHQYRVTLTPVTSGSGNYNTKKIDVLSGYPQVTSTGIWTGTFYPNSDAQITAYALYNSPKTRTITYTNAYIGYMVDGKAGGTHNGGNSSWYMPSSHSGLPGVIHLGSFRWSASGAPIASVAVHGLTNSVDSGIAAGASTQKYMSYCVVGAASGKRVTSVRVSYLTHSTAYMLVQLPKDFAEDLIVYWNYCDQ